MANLAELAEQRSRLSAAETDHLQRLLGTWGLLADLSFSDLMLFGRDRSADDEHSMVVLGQIRPTTIQTLFTNDWVGRVVTALERPLVDQTFLTGAFAEGEIPPGAHEGPVRETCIPVTFGGRTIAVLTKDGARCATEGSVRITKRNFRAAPNWRARKLGRGTIWRTWPP